MEDFTRINYQYKRLMISFEKADILPTNKELVMEFIQSCRLGLFQKKIGMQRTVRTLNSLKRLCQLVPPGIAWHDVTKKEIRGLLIAIEELQVGEWEKYSLLMSLKKFVTWLRTEYGYPENYLDREKLLALLPVLNVAPEVKITIVRPNKLKPLSEIPTSEEIRYMMDACDTYKRKDIGIRDKAFIAILEELGARIGGIGPLKIRDIIFDDIGALISIIDKTMRGEPVRIIKSVPALKAWLDLHPLKNNPDAPLWVNLRGKNKLQPMDYQTARNALSTTVDVHNETAALRGLPKIERRIHFHAFRYYAQARDALAGMPIAVMCKQRGWSPTSKQPQRYARISSEQVDAWLVSHATV